MSFCLSGCYSWAFLEVIIDAFVEAGLVLEKDAQQKLKVWHDPIVSSVWFMKIFLVCIIQHHSLPFGFYKLHGSSGVVAY